MTILGSFEKLNQIFLFSIILQKKGNILNCQDYSFNGFKNRTKNHKYNNLSLEDDISFPAKLYCLLRETIFDIHVILKKYKKKYKYKIKIKFQN